METKPLLSLFSNKTTPVKVVANAKTGSIVTPLLDKMTGIPKLDARGQPLGSIMLQQENTTMNGTFMNVRNRVSFITSTVADLQKLVDAHGLKEGTPVGGKILIEESLIPFYVNQPSKIVPVPPGGNGVPRRIGVTLQDKFYPVYMQMRYVEDDKMADFLIRNPQDLVSWFDKNKELVDVSKLGEAAPQPEGLIVPNSTGGKIPAIVGP
jgi:hypothetical protein